jgi:hypothetical protein
MVGRALYARLQLWGMPILWWGRIGKLAEFTAGLVVVLDLIGPDRLRAFGLRSQERATILLLPLLRTAVRSVASAWRGSGRDWGDGRKTLAEAMAWLASVVLAGWLIWFFAPYAGWYRILYWIWGAYAVPLALILVLFLVVSPISLALFVVVYVPMLLLTLLSLVTGRLLDREQPGHPARWIAFLLFIVGFHFDLLAS